MGCSRMLLLLLPLRVLAMNTAQDAASATTAEAEAQAAAAAAGERDRRMELLCVHSPKCIASY